jgi:ADP-ribose pyrophosphatase
MDVFSDEVELSDGKISTREVVKKPNAVAVVALQDSPPLYSISYPSPQSPPARGGEEYQKLYPFAGWDGAKILMVKQFRYAVGEAMLEIPAGKIDAGEEPLHCAKRELEEETGYVAANWQPLGFIYVSAGFTNEKIYLYLATGLTYKQAHPDEGEIIECYEYPLRDIFDMINSGEINDAKTICALMRADERLKC